MPAGGEIRAPAPRGSRKICPLALTRIFVRLMLGYAVRPAGAWAARRALVGEERIGTAPLTPAQRRRVEENLGLVALHLRENVPNLRWPRREREWDDLFQEGCIGLMRAAVRFDPEAGIPFAAFALSRIHTAVSQALARRFSTIYVPPHRSRRRASQTEGGYPRMAKRKRERDRDPAAGRRRAGKRRGPSVYSMADDAEREYAARHDPLGEGETIGERLRGKYERAVRAAQEEMAGRATRRRDRAALIDALVDERLLIPQEDRRTALREIARRTRSSYARVADCDKRLRESVAERLRHDPEYAHLQRCARRSVDSQRTVIDPKLEAALRRLSAAELVRRFTEGDGASRGRVASALFQERAEQVRDLLSQCLTDLNAAARERILQRTMRHSGVASDGAGDGQSDKPADGVAASSAGRRR